MLANLYLSPVPSLLSHLMSSPLINIMSFTSIHFSLVHKHETFSLALPFAKFCVFFSFSFSPPPSESLPLSSPGKLCFQVLFKCLIYCVAFSDSHRDESSEALNLYLCHSKPHLYVIRLFICQSSPLV